MKRTVGSILLVFLLLSAGCNAQIGSSSEEEYELKMINNHSEPHTVTVNYTGSNDRFSAAGATTIRFQTTLNPKTNATIRNIPYEQGDYDVVVTVDGEQRAEFSPDGFYFITVKIYTDGTVAASGPGGSD